VRARIRRSIGSSTALVVTAVAVLLAMNELSRLIGEVLATDGHTHALAAVIGLGAGAELDAWADWRTAAFSPAGFILIHALLGLVFVGCYTVLGLRLYRFVAAEQGSVSRRPLVLLCGLIAADVAKNLLLVILAFVPQPGSVPVLLVIAVYARWAAVIAIALFAVFGTLLGTTIRGFLRTASLALYAQRLSAMVVGVVAAISLLSADGVLEQISDAYRGWLQYPTSGMGAVPSVNLSAVLAAAGAFVITGVSIFALSRQRARQYSRRSSEVDDRPDGPTWPWYAFAAATAVVAIALALVTGGRNVDWLTTCIFVGILAVIAAASSLVRRLGLSIAPPLFTTKLDGRAEAVSLTGDLLVVAWVAIALLAPYKAFISPLMLAGSGAFAGSRFAASFTSLLLIELALVALAITAAVFVRRKLAAPPRDREAGSATAAVAAAFSDTTPRDERVIAQLRRYGRVVVVISLAVIVAVLLFPRPIAYALGPVAALVLLIGCWTTIIGAAIIALGSVKPLEVFQLLRLRSTPLVTLLVILPTLVSFVDGAAALHAIRTAHSGTATARDSLSDGFAAWYEEQACTRTLPDSGLTVMPLLLVAAEGGGIRAATWTVDVLRELPRDGECAAGATLLSSGASGGSIGIASFRDAPSAADLTTVPLGGPGALSADVAGLLGGDLIASTTGLRFPSPVDYSDLGGEWAWQDRTALQEATWGDDSPPFAAGYTVEPQSPTGYAVFNSTDSISNCKVIVSQLDLHVQASSDVDVVAGPNAPACNGRNAELADTVDLQDYLGDCIFDLNWATAAELSARFPIISPAGRVSNDTLPADCNQVGDMQLVDGGLTDNSALSTISDLSPELVQLITATNAQADGADLPFVVPIVMYITNKTGADIVGTPDGTRPEVLIPLSALLNAPLALTSAGSWLTRLSTTLGNVCPPGSAGCEIALREVRHEVPQGVAVVQPSTIPSVSVPLGWTLSPFSRTRLRLEAETQALCGKDGSDVECFTGGGYGRLGDVLDLFADD
jgi:hypothetical protein